MRGGADPSPGPDKQAYNLRAASSVRKSPWSLCRVPRPRCPSFQTLPTRLEGGVSGHRSWVGGWVLADEIQKSFLVTTNQQRHRIMMFSASPFIIFCEIGQLKHAKSYISDIVSRFGLVKNSH